MKRRLWKGGYNLQRGTAAESGGASFAGYFER